MPTKDDNIVQDSPNLKLKEKEDELKFHPRQLKPQTAEPAKPLVEVSHTEETVEERNRPRGVPRHWTRLYKADAQSMFTCTDSREKIPFKHMNDDYCDCKDGSDEPGTSACINGRSVLFNYFSGHCLFCWGSPGKTPEDHVFTSIRYRTNDKITKYTLRNKMLLMFRYNSI